MEIRPGSKLFSAVSEVQVVVVRAPETEVTIGCGGQSMLPEEPESTSTPSADLLEGPAMGKRYAEEELGLELLCTRPGDGTLTADGKPLSVKGAKPLPSSD